MKRSSLGCKDELSNMIHSINRMNDKDHKNISIDEEEALNKIYHIFMIKTLNKHNYRKTYLNIIKATAIV